MYRNFRTQNLIGRRANVRMFDWRAPHVGFTCGGFHPGDSLFVRTIDFQSTFIQTPTRKTDVWGTPVVASLGLHALCLSCDLQFSICRTGSEVCVGSIEDPVPLSFSISYFFEPNYSDLLSHKYLLRVLTLRQGLFSLSGFGSVASFFGATSGTQNRTG
jgi:hypothetical protein